MIERNGRRDASDGALGQFQPLSQPPEPAAIDRPRAMALSPELCGLGKMTAGVQRLSRTGSVWRRRSVSCPRSSVRHSSKGDRQGNAHTLWSMFDCMNVREAMLVGSPTRAVNALVGGGRSSDGRCTGSSTLCDCRYFRSPVLHALGVRLLVSNRNRDLSTRP